MKTSDHSVWQQMWQMGFDDAQKNLPKYSENRHYVDGYNAGSLAGKLKDNSNGGIVDPSVAMWFQQ